MLIDLIKLLSLHQLMWWDTALTHLLYMSQIPKIKLECGPVQKSDGRPAEHRWRLLFNAAKFGWRPLLDAVQ